MSFENGKKKTGGRKKGTPNRLTKEMRGLLKSIYERELENLEDYMDKLTPKERLDFFLKLAPYVLPKVSNIHMRDGEPINFDI